MRRVCITGANRGIGLEIVRQCLARGDRVFAACRDPGRAQTLNEWQRESPETLTILALDVADPAQVDAAAKKISAITDALDLLFNNAAVNPRGEHLGNLQAAVLLETLQVNSVAPIILIQELLPLLANGQQPKIINITSQLGSISRKRSGGRYSYDGSKAALNMFTRTLAFELVPRGILAAVIHPGWVRTDMGGSSAPLSVEESVYGILRVADNLTSQQSGAFLQWDGSELPW